MFRLRTAIFRLNLREYVYTYIYIMPLLGSPEDDSKKPKHVAYRCKFIKYLIESRVKLYFITLINSLFLWCIVPSYTLPLTQYLSVLSVRALGKPTRFPARFDMLHAGNDTMITTFWSHSTAQGHREVFLPRESQLQKRRCIFCWFIPNCDSIWSQNS